MTGKEGKTEKWKGRERKAKNRRGREGNKRSKGHENARTLQGRERTTEKGM